MRSASAIHATSDGKRWRTASHFNPPTKEKDAVEQEYEYEHEYQYEHEHEYQYEHEHEHEYEYEYELQYAHDEMLPQGAARR
jgi:hypothetical protein